MSVKPLLCLDLCLTCITDAVLGFSVFTLVITLPSIKNPLTQRIGVYVWLGVLVVLHSALIGLFKLKNPGVRVLLLLICKADNLVTVPLLVSVLEGGSRSAMTKLLLRCGSGRAKARQLQRQVTNPRRLPVPL